MRDFLKLIPTFVVFGMAAATIYTIFMTLKLRKAELNILGKTEPKLKAIITYLFGGFVICDIIAVIILLANINVLPDFACYLSIFLVGLGFTAFAYLMVILGRNFNRINELKTKVEIIEKNKEESKQLKGSAEMSDYKFKATRLIAENFGQKFKFFVDSDGDNEQLMVTYSIKSGPNIVIRFISKDNDNDFTVCVLGLITSVPQEKRMQVMDVCNMLNSKFRFIRFYISVKGDVHLQYDCPLAASDDCVGEMAFEISVRIAKILDESYGVFMKALYSNEGFPFNTAERPAQTTYGLEIKE